jgi:homopolymeric O-antigen transport system ATP-binding protein
MVYIKADNLGVTFHVYGKRARNLRASLIPASVGGILKRNNNDDIVTVNALKNVSLELKVGDRLGLIGQNGSGKTTLLRTLGGVYEPTMGSVEVAGKLAALTDMSLGMDPEASGYENIIIRSICMGMTLKEAKALVSEIESFTELGSFLSLPLRTYSAGMAVRLAFAISTNIEPDILIMDEMISAGDLHFIEKARKRIRSLLDNVGILVLASHNLEIISQFCNKVALLHHGEIIEWGDVEHVATAYQRLTN